PRTRRARRQTESRCPTGVWVAVAYRPRGRRGRRSGRGSPHVASSAVHELAGLVDLLLDDVAFDRLAVPGERALPRAERVRIPLLPEAQIPEVILDDRVVRHLRRGLGKRRFGLCELPLLEVRPAQAVEEGWVPR